MRKEKEVLFCSEEAKGVEGKNCVPRERPRAREKERLEKVREEMSKGKRMEESKR